MKLYLSEITDQEKELSFSDSDDWVKTAVLRVDEHGDAPAPPSTRKIAAKFSMRAVDEVVVASGKIETHVELICSRCATSVPFPCNFKFSALFCKDPVMAGVGYLHQHGGPNSKDTRPAAHSHGHARHAHDFSVDDSPSGTRDLDITYLSNDFIDLGEVLTEQLQLQIPFQPLCKETCMGMCSQCGTDLNHGRCACAKLERKHPFSVLRDLKI